MQESDLNHIKTELEDYKQMLLHNNICLIDCAVRINDIINSTPCLKEEIDKRCDYFQELYFNKNFFYDVITPLSEYTLKRLNQDDMKAFIHKTIIRDFSINDLKKENWKGYYSDGFEVPNVEDFILGNVPQEDKKIIEVYKEFLNKAEEIPKTLYIREIYYFETLIFYKDSKNILNQLLEFKDSFANILTIIRILVYICENAINQLSVKNDETLKNTLIINERQAHMPLKHNLTEEELTILRCRAELSPNNSYKDIIKHLSLNMSENNIKQKAKNINTKLGSKNIDEAVRIFENTYFKLSE